MRFFIRLLSAIITLSPLIVACGAGDDWTQQPEDEIDTVDQASTSSRNFGLHCTETFEKDYLDPMGDGWATCNNFASKLDDAATKKFSYNLTNKQYYWHDTGDHAVDSLEDVDLFFSYTHGGAWTPTYAEWGMWNFNTLATTDQMRLGDENRGLSILATWSCATLQQDEFIWGRWDQTFKGGLRGTLGSHGDMYLGNNATAATKFASLLNQGSTFKSAWVNSFGATSSASDVAVMFSGSTRADCESRRDNMSWANFQNYARRRDAAAAWWCSWYWDDV